MMVALLIQLITLIYVKAGVITMKLMMNLRDVNPLRFRKMSVHQLQQQLNTVIAVLIQLIGLICVTAVAVRRMMMLMIN